MPNLIKFGQQQGSFQLYDFQEETFEPRKALEEESSKEKPKNEKEQVKTDSAPETEDLSAKGEDAQAKPQQLEKEKQPETTVKSEDYFQRVGQVIIDNAKKEAAEILKKAKMDAQQLKEEAAEEGQKEGYEAGYENGKEEAYRQLKEAEEEKTQEFFEELKQIINEVTLKKERILADYKSGLVDLAVAVAEKVVQVSLKSSGEIIERMILSATERLASKEWVKIYISKTDAEMMIEGGIDIIQALSNLSENIKVIPMEKEGQGICIIEFPDEIIDASANTQVENIREIISNSSV